MWKLASAALGYELNETKEINAHAGGLADSRWKR